MRIEMRREPTVRAVAFGVIVRSQAPARSMDGDGESAGVERPDEGIE